MFIIYSFLIQWPLATIHNCTSCGHIPGAYVCHFRSGVQSSTHMWGTWLTISMTKIIIGGWITSVPLAIKSISPICRQPARGQFNTLVSSALGVVTMITRQRLRCQAACSKCQVMLWPWEQYILDTIIDEDDNTENCADPGPLSSGRSHPGDGNVNEDGEGEQDIQGTQIGTGKRKRTRDVKGKWRAPEHQQETRNWKGMATEDRQRNWNGNGIEKCIVKQLSGGDDVICTIALQVPKEMYETDSDKEG